MLHADSVMASALDSLRARDRRRGTLAAEALSVVRHLLGDAPMSRLVLQRVLWIQVPQRWPGRAGEVVESLALLFDECGFARYAATCRSRETTEVLAAYRRGFDAGIRRYRAAEDRSGIEPPHLDGLGWTACPGAVEQDAYRAVTAALEIAVETGDYQPGRRGWRGHRDELAAACLHRLRPELAAGTFAAEIRRERVLVWADAGGSARRDLLRALAAGLDRPADPPDDCDGLGGALWALDAARTGFRLNEDGDPPAQVVARGRGVLRSSPSPGTGAADTAALLVSVLIDLGALQQSGRTVRTSAAGRAFLADPEALWRACASELWWPNAPHHAVAELALALLLRDGRSWEDELVREITPMVGDMGWRVTTTNRRPDEQETRLGLLRFAWIAEPLGVIDLSGEWTEHGTFPNRVLSLTPLGRATAHQALHVRATRARPPEEEDVR